MLLLLNNVELQARLETFQTTFHEVVKAPYLIKRSQSLDGNSITIALGANELQGDVDRVRSEREIDEWATMLSLGDAFSLHLAFNEDWQRVPPDKSDWRRIIASELFPTENKKTISKSVKSNDLWLFDGLRLRFYLKRTAAKSSSEGFYQWLRCEWEPYEHKPFDENSRDLFQHKKNKQIAEQLTFPGSVAAHPHFHFDSVPLNSSARAESMPPLRSTFKALDEVADQVAEFGHEIGPNWFLQSSSTALGHIHLPTITTWQHTTCADVMGKLNLPTASAPLPHQHYPRSTSELDKWFTWCVSYFNHQFEEYIKD